MRQRVLYVVLALAAYGLFLLATAPARIALPYLARDLPASLTLADARGSIWSGRVALLAHTAAGPKALSRVRFSFSLLPILHGALGYDMHFSGPLRGHLVAAVGSRSADFSNLNLVAQAATLAVLVPAAQDFGPSGLLHLVAAHILWGPRLAGGGLLTWTQAALVSAPVSPLGTYEARFILRHGVVHYSVHTLSGRLEVSGRGGYVADTGILSFTGTVLGQGFRLGGLVQNIGTPNGRGGRRVSFEAPL